jgi:hypothetical protein
MCWAAKWYGDKNIMFRSIKDVGHKRMLKQIHDLLDEADVVVHYNGRSFDIPTLNKEFVINGMNPPAPYKQVDLYHAVRGAFRFLSNKLDYVTKALDLGQKVRHEGQELWTKCMRKEPTAWKRMKKYNIGDVVLLEKLYDRIKPWIKGHPNHSTYSMVAACPQCGETNTLQRRGTASTAKGTYARFQCVGTDGCGAWSKGPEVERKNPAKRLVAL